MRLGILGGTFDPIHVGHLLMAETVREKLSLNRVLFTPAGDPPHKQGRQISPDGQRRQMVSLAIANHPQFELCPVDLERSGPHYSVETVPLIREQYDLAADDCFFIIGGDSLADLPDWHQPERLIRQCRLAVIHRAGYQADMDSLEAQIPGLSDRLDWVETPTIQIAASTIRERVAQGRSIRYQVIEPVREYIQEQGLYRDWGQVASSK